jgi:hypothetical protein
VQHPTVQSGEVNSTEGVALPVAVGPNPNTEELTLETTEF